MAGPGRAVERGADQDGPSHGHLQGIGAVGRRLLEAQFGIQPLERVELHARLARELLEARRCGHGNDLVGEWRSGRDDEAVALGLARDQRGGLDGGDVVLGLVFQPSPPGEDPEVGRAHGADGLGHGPLAGVVRRLCQVPGAEHGVEIDEVAGGRRRGLLRVETLVQPAVYPQAVAPGRGRHELPDAPRPGARGRERVEPALDHGGEDQVLGQALLLEHVQHHRQVTARANQPPLDDRSPVARLEPIEEAPHVMVVLDLVARRGQNGRREDDFRRKPG